MILITGATGFLGSHLAARLLIQGKNLVLLKRRNSLLPEILEPFHAHFEWREADLLDIFALEKALEGITEIYHCGAMVSFDSVDAKQMLRTNIEGTANLVNYALKAKVRRLLHVSSVAAIGEGKKGGLSDEASVWEKSNETSIYALSKFESQREVWRGGVEGLEVNIVNPSLILGEPDWEHGTGLMFKLVRDQALFYPIGANGYIGVDDVTACMQLIMESQLKDEQFILSAENLSFKQLFDQIALRLRIPAPKFALKPWMLTAGWRLSSLIGIKGLSRDLALGACAIASFDSTKATRMLGHTFTPVKKVIDQICTKAEQARQKPVGKLAQKPL